MKEEFSSCVKFYDELPEEAYELGYDRYSDFFKGNLLNFLYPHKSNERNCLKVNLFFKKEYIKYDKFS